MLKRISLLLISVAILSCNLSLADTIAIRGAEIHTMKDQILKCGVVLIRDGKIIDINEDIYIPFESRVIDAQGYILYPGFITSFFLGDLDSIRNFESLSPDSDSLDYLNFFLDYQKYLIAGLTSIAVGYPDQRLIPGRGGIIKLKRGQLNPMTIIKREAFLWINFCSGGLLPPMINIFPAPVGTNNPVVPSKKQFPSSILGAFWTIHQLFTNTLSYAGDLSKYLKNLSISLKDIKGRKLPLIARCHKAADILRIIELAQILKIPLVIYGADEAYKLVDILKENNVSVIANSHVICDYSIFDKEFLTENENYEYLENIPTLIKKGITLSVSPTYKRHLPNLLWVVSYYQKFGISEEELLKTVTINPAKVLGVEDRIGSLEKGKDADILFFKKVRGKPFPELKKIMIEGEIIYEKK